MITLIALYVMSVLLVGHHLIAVPSCRRRDDLWHSPDWKAWLLFPRLSYSKRFGRVMVINLFDNDLSYTTVVALFWPVKVALSIMLLVGVGICLLADRHRTQHV